MQAAIDKAGRVVIPAAVRAKAGFRPGTKLEIEADEFSVRLFRKAEGSKLVRRGGRLVAQPPERLDDSVDVDLAALVEDERNR